MKKWFLTTPIFLGMLGIIPPAMAAHVCYAPSSGFSEMTDSGQTFHIWSVPGADSHGVWIKADKPESRLTIAYIQGRLDRAADKNAVVHIRFGDDGSFWSISDVMTEAKCLQQMP